MRAAIIDIGSSSVKLIIGEKQGEEVKTLESLKNVIDIGKSTFYKGRISQPLIDQTVSLLEKYKQVIKSYEVTDVTVIATTAVREAANQDIFQDTVFRKTGFKIEILNVGDVVYYIDAFLSYKLKQVYPIHERNLLIAELGTGSLDISFMEKGFTLMNLGIPIGTVRLKQFKSRIEGSLEETFQAVSEYVETEIMSLKNVFPKIPIDDIILIDESYSAYLPHFFPAKKYESSFFKFQSRDAKQLISRIKNRNSDDISHQFKIPSSSAELIDGYAIILNTLFQLARTKSIYILETSLSEALLTTTLNSVELAKKYNKENQLISVAKFLCQKFNLDFKHARSIANLSETLFNALKDVLGLQPEEGLYLTLAAYLHNIGLSINNRSHHKHSEYIISSLSLFRLTDQEIKIIAAIARYHRRSSPQKSHLLYNSLSLDKQILVQKLSAILRIANALDRSHKQKIKKLEIDIKEKKEISIVVYTADNFVLEKAMFKERKELFEEVSGSKINLVVRKQEVKDEKKQ